ncbi:MAG: glucosyll transferase family 2 [Rhizobiales bacterium]|nr:glucosyll transferase family 2 [Hyphomicrobiales bacterium]
MPVNKLNIAVGIATTGRREVLSRTIDILATQMRLPDRLVICPVVPGDVDVGSLERFPAPATVVSSPAGLAAQRNGILAAVKDSDVVVFFDDDYFPDARYLANLEKIFLERPDVVGSTGFLLADGAQGPGLSVEQGVEILGSAPEDLGSLNEPQDWDSTYGCNMSFRLKPIVEHNVLFDENLPLYGWQEDIDFSRRLHPYGQIVLSGMLLGVHLGIKAGRTSGVRFGYSQIANPIYLIRKGSMPRRFASRIIWRNVAANLLRSAYPEPWIDRRGRLKGNLLALLDVIKGRISPGRILHMR